MKTFYILLCIAIASLTQLQAQAPQGFNYQATVRNSSGDLIVNTNVYFKFNIMQGSQTSLPVFTEIHYVPTDDLGQVNLVIGEGTASTGTFSELDWSLGSYYLGIELDTGNGYVAMGTTQLLSVPYALYAENSGNSTPITPSLETVLSENNSANNQQIKDLQDPTDAQDAVTKNYTDTQFYTQSEVDAMISNLQGQIDDLNYSNDSGTVTDIDGNSYDYLTYGTQQWTVENAEMVTYRDGTPIPQVTDATEWENLTTGAWCYYDNDPTKGKLYNWYAVAGIHDTDPNTPNKELAPEGWHVPTTAECYILEEHLIANGYNYDGTTTGNKIAKSMASTTGWISSTYAGAVGNDQSLNNSSGFNAFPEGYRWSSVNGSNVTFFMDEGVFANFWTSSTSSPDSADYRFLNHHVQAWVQNSYPKKNGHSVRFVKDADVDQNDIDNDGDGYSENQGDCDDANANVNPGATEIEDGIDNDCDGEIDEGFNQSGTITDIDGNSYDYLTYGTQQWTVANAEMVTYRDGTPIPQVTDATEWENLTTGAWCYYDNDPTKGKLYNWYAVAGIHDAASWSDTSLRKEFAPEGWHVPSDAEWTTLEYYLIANGYNYDGTTTENKIGKAMASTTGWTSSTETGAIGNDQSLNNSSGFNAFPEGIRNNNGSFNNVGGNTMFWSSSENSIDNAWDRNFYYGSSNLYRYITSKHGGFSVRFLKDADVDQNDIDNDGDGYSENQGDCDDANANVNPGATEIEDGIDNDCDGEIDEGFNQSGTVTDIDGNSYDYLTYGTQQWTVANAEMVTYRDGTPIPQVTDITEWINLTTGAWCYYNNDPTKPRLYNWYAVAGIHDAASLSDASLRKEFAPEGWHVPSDAEWTTLEYYLIANGYNYDGTITESKIAKAMASTTGWISSTIAGAPGSEQSLNNSSGFNASPEGVRTDAFTNAGYMAAFWSSTSSFNDSIVWSRILYDSSDLGRTSNDMRIGFSVRFVRD